MCDGEELATLGQSRQPFADRARHRAADAAIDLVEDHRRRPALLGERDLEREDEARQLAAAGDLVERGEVGAGVGGDQELDTVHARLGPSVLRPAR